jgi:hypothetical protein
MDESDDSLMKKGKILLAAINTASRTPFIVARLKGILFKNKKQPQEILNKQEEEQQTSNSYQLTQSYSVIRTSSRQ